MGDRLATTDIGRKWGVVPLWGAESPSNTVSPGPTRAYRHTKWHLDPSSRLATTDMGRNWGEPPFLWGAGSLFNTVWPGPRPTSLPNGILVHPAVWPQRTWAENGRAVPLLVELGPHLAQCGVARGPSPYKLHLDLSNRLATIHQLYRQLGQDRQDNGPIA